MDDDECRELQQDELVAVQSIFCEPADMLKVNQTNDIVTISLQVCLENAPYELTCLFQLPKTYPQHAPTIQVDAPWLTDSQADLISHTVLKEFHPMEMFVCEAIEWLKGEVAELLNLSPDTKHDEAVVPSKETDHDSDQKESVDESPSKNPELPTILHGDIFIDRKSRFQAHVAEVHSKHQAALVQAELLRNSKIARATHNIMAYRITDPNTSQVMADNDDDGENAAGGKLAELLQLIQADNLIVVVSRWYGGILLGPDRFRHINNVARVLIEACGLSKRAGPAHDGSTVSRKSRSSKKRR